MAQVSKQIISTLKSSTYGHGVSATHNFFSTFRFEQFACLAIVGAMYSLILIRSPFPQLAEQELQSVKLVVRHSPEGKTDLIRKKKPSLIKRIVIRYRYVFYLLWYLQSRRFHQNRTYYPQSTISW